MMKVLNITFYTQVQPEVISWKSNNQFIKCIAKGVSQDTRESLGLTFHAIPIVWVYMVWKLPNYY